MNFFTTLTTGIVIAWIASLLMETEGREDFKRNIFAGIGGAFVGSWLLGSVADPTPPGQFSFAVLLASLCGAGCLLYVVSRMSRA